jgi:hypothetical protein
VYKSPYPRCGCVRTDSLGIGNDGHDGTPQMLTQQHVLPAVTGVEVNDNEVRELPRMTQKLKEQLHDARRVSGPDPDAMRPEAPHDEPFFNNGTATHQTPVDGSEPQASCIIPRSERPPFRADIQDTQEKIHGRYFERRGAEPTGMEHHIDTITTADSGYHSGTRNSCTNVGEGDANDNDTDSVVTDGWPSSLPKQDRYLLEAEFAREMFNRSSTSTREQFAEQGEMVMDLLYSFSVMIGGRATSVAEKRAASFVRRGRK